MDRVDRMVPDGSIVTFLGVVSETPEIVERPEGPGAPGAWRDDQARFGFDVRSIKLGDGALFAASGVVGVSSPPDVIGVIRIGDRCVISGVFRPPSGTRNPGEPDWSRLGNERGMGGWLSVPDIGLIEVEGGAHGVWGSARRIRAWVRERARRALGPDEWGVLSALVLGERDASFDATYRVFQRAGIAHVLAVSGFHLALLGGFVALMVRTTGERGRLETLAVLVVVGVMLLMVPARAPIVRAGVLVIALLLGDAAGRRSDRLAVLAWAGVGLLIWRPSDASGLGFLLSVGVTATLLGLAEMNRGRRWSLFERASSLSGPGGSGAVGAGWFAAAKRWLIGAGRVNVSCWMIATPTIVVSTGVCSLIAPLATLVIVPMAAVLLVIGWAQAIFGVAWPSGAASTAGIAGWFAGAVGGTAGWLDGFVWSSLTVTGVGWVWCVLTTGGIALWMFRPCGRMLAGGFVVCCVVYAGIADARSGRVAGLRADMLDVGDGTSVLIRSGDEAVLWDCGGLHTPIGRTAADAARALGVGRVRVGIVTHANLDHFNGMLDAAQLLGIETLLVTPALFSSYDGEWGEMRGMLEAEGVEVVALKIGDVFTVGQASAVVLWAGGSDDERWLGNDGSLVVRFSIETDAGERSLLMCGDLQTAGVAGLLATDTVLASDIMEAPHHGSANLAAVEFVRMVSPSVVLQSTGRTRVGLDAWAESRRDSRWLSTAQLGAVFAEISQDGSIVTGSVIERASSE